jgi:pimeloyl-ACP methyl ester carboxylesterase
MGVRSTSQQRAGRGRYEDRHLFGDDRNGEGYGQDVTREKTTPFIALQLAAVLWGIAIVPVALILLVVAVTWTGRVFAVAAAFAGIAPFVGTLAWYRGTLFGRRAATAIVSVCIVLFGVLVWRAPDGGPPVVARVQHLDTGGGWRFHRFAPGNVLPEVDQLMLGFTIMPFLDPLFTQTQASQLKRWTAEIYTELERDADFHELGSVLPDVAAECLGLGENRGHAYLYVPRGIDRSQSHPVLVFLHGYGGNFKAYLWLLSQVADRLDLVVVAPSFGLGKWRSPGTEMTVAATLAAVRKVVNVDPAAIHLLGLSNGGLAVSQLAGEAGARYRSFGFLSPVFDVNRIKAGSMADVWRSKPVFVLSGSLDDRVPMNYVQDQAAAIQRGGGHVQVEFVDDADHFLIFSHREQVIRRLTSWFADNGAIRSRARDEMKPTGRKEF